MAVDVQGPDAARPWYQKHGVTFPALVDSANTLGRLIGYKIIPNQFYIDELGIFHGSVSKAQLAKLLAKPMADVPADLARRLQKATPSLDYAALRDRAESQPGDYAVQLAAGRAALAAAKPAAAVVCLERAVHLRPQSAEALTELAAAHLAGGDKAAAAAALKRARKLDPENWLIRKQIWALEQPEHFYEGPVDFAWQREQIRRENNAG